jgi:hypothetical protein
VERIKLYSGIFTPSQHLNQIDQYKNLCWLIFPCNLWYALKPFL